MTDFLDLHYLRSLLGAAEDAANATPESLEELIRETEKSKELGVRWLEEYAESEGDDDQHKEIVYPLYLMSSNFIGNLVNPMGKEAVALYTMASAILRIAVQKGYEKGRREVLARTVLLGEVGDGD